MNGGYTGREIDGFLVQEVVEDRFGMVIYRAVQTSVKRFVSFKSIPLPSDDDERDLFLREFRRQIEESITLEHTHLLPIYASGHIGREAVYIVSRLLPGSLDGLLRVGALPVEMALPIARQISQTVTYLHGQHFVHSSLSPKVVYITSESSIYVNDLEMAQIVQRAPSIEFLQKVLGVLNYAAPEVLRRESITYSADIYSVGATLYDLVTGEPPFRSGLTAGTILTMKEANALRPPTTFNASVSPELEAIIMRSMRADPQERFPSAQAMTEALEAVGGYAARWQPLDKTETRLTRWYAALRRWLRRL